MEKTIKSLFIVLFAVTITACVNKGPIGGEIDGPPDDLDVTDQQMDGQDGQDAQAISMADADPSNQLDPLDDPESPLTQRVIYFEFDSAKVKSGDLAALEAHGGYLAERADVHVRLEGHADERGSREYNIGLGDRRAQSIRRLLLFQGAVSDQIETISYGEERPAVAGHNENAWGQNRRVEIVYEIN
ncbi:MAG: peptidoglycan-associated lipoprotein Pal [Gammaproteobacteria bacterium]|nr:peptidoglycan-associated lipoprotein Pal [Gammaproteobacteria bacterium]